jgi:NAD(P)-dependent dehydrogenase (short-subunit alcohol dehydrogenase family)
MARIHQEEARMEVYQGKTAFITGGASGIGRALAQALAARGAIVRLADLDLAGAQRVASECGGGASTVALDVCDAEAVRAAVEAFAREHGRLDYIFNNAGIGAGGEAQDIPPAMWRKTIDVDLYGVLHGVWAAYPLMMKQRSGHIVNTASLAGLGPAPFLAPYALCKHAVVGLSTSLRIEAAAHGVRVSALCPGLIDTPLLQKTESQGVAIPWAPDVRRYLTRVAGQPYPVDKCAEETLASVARNVGVIVLPTRARVGWRLGRWFPWLAERATAYVLNAERKARAAAVPET